MSKRLAVTCVALAVSACATPSSSGPAKPGATEPAREKLAVMNNSPFDLAVCPATRTMALEPLSEEVVMGALLTKSASFQECFLDAKAVQGAPADVVVKVTVADGASVTVTGTGLSESGKACLEAAAKSLSFPKSTTPVAGQVPVMVGVKPVAWGQNVASDVAGTVRLALPSMCGCFAELGDASPPEPLVKLRLTAEAPPDVVVDGVAANPGMATCVAEKVKALALPKAAVEMTLPIILVNGWASEATAGLPGPLQFQQLEAIRARRTAEVLMAAGRRGVTALRYDEVVKKYKAKPNSTLIAELRTKCADVLTADDAQLASLKALVDVYQAETKLVQAEKAKDPAWANVEAGLGQQLTKATGEVVRVEQQRGSDSNACPKNK